MIDRILYNGNIRTFDPDQPQITALAIIGENIVAAGTDDKITPLAHSNTQLDNLAGRFVMPGMVDAHIHWEATAKARHSVNLFNAKNKAEALERIATYVQAHPADEWIFGRGWAQDDWEEREFPTAQDLDPITGGRPAYFITKSGHAAWVNSAALRLAGIDQYNPDPAGGKVKRFDDGTPDGILLEDSAMVLVSQHIPDIPPERLVEWMLEAQTEVWKTGLIGSMILMIPHVWSGCKHCGNAVCWVCAWSNRLTTNGFTTLRNLASAAALEMTGYGSGR